jgi:hypothetical protein
MYYVCKGVSLSVYVIFFNDGHRGAAMVATGQGDDKVLPGAEGLSSFVGG